MVNIKTKQHLKTDKKTTPYTKQKFAKNMQQKIYLVKINKN